MFDLKTTHKDKTQKDLGLTETTWVYQNDLGLIQKRVRPVSFSNGY